MSGYHIFSHPIFCFAPRCLVCQSLNYILNVRYQTELCTRTSNGNLILMGKSSLMALCPFALFINTRHRFSSWLLSAIAWHRLFSSVGKCNAAACELQASPLPCARVEGSTSTSASTHRKPEVHLFCLNMNHERGD